MEVLASLSETLQPYKDLVSTGTSVVTIIQLLTPILLLNDIRKAKTAAGFSILPFLGGGVL
jgi:hypothetical protein